MRYRKRPTKPEEVEAIQVRRRFPWPDWFHSAVSCNDIITHNIGKFENGSPHCYIKTKTRLGERTAKENDFIIKHQDGTFSVCKPSEFEKEWEEI